MEIDADGATERATVQESQDNVELVGCSNARGASVLHQCRMAQRGVQQCEMHGDVAVAQRSEREHLSATGRALASEYVSSPIERSIGSFFVPRVAGATTLGRCVACRTFQRYRIGFELKPFLLRRSVEKWQQEMLKIALL